MRTSVHFVNSSLSWRQMSTTSEVIELIMTRSSHSLIQTVRLKMCLTGTCSWQMIESTRVCTCLTYSPVHFAINCPVVARSEHLFQRSMHDELKSFSRRLLVSHRPNNIDTDLPIFMIDIQRTSVRYVQSDLAKTSDILTVGQMQSLVMTMDMKRKRLAEFTGRLRVWWISLN